MGEALELCWFFIVETDEAVLVSCNDTFELMIHQLDVLERLLKLGFYLYVSIWYSNNFSRWSCLSWVKAFQNVFDVTILALGKLRKSLLLVLSIL